MSSGPAGVVERIGSTYVSSITSVPQSTSCTASRARGQEVADSSDSMAPGIAAEAVELAARIDVWRDRAERAATLVGTPCYVTAWEPVQRAGDRLRTLQRSVPIRLWLSLKTHPLPHLAASWLRTGSGVEVVSEVELRTALSLGCDADHLLVNGVAKHTWLSRYPIPGLRVHFDSLTEIARLLPAALANRWRVGVRCHAPTERDAREPLFGGPFGLERAEAVT